MSSTARIIGITFVLLSGVIAGVIATRTCDASPTPSAPAKCTAVLAPGESC